MTVDLQKPRIPKRHPGGRTCRAAIVQAAVLTFAAMLKHPGEVARMWTELKSGDESQ